MLMSLNFPVKTLVPQSQTQIGDQEISMNPILKEYAFIISVAKIVRVHNFACLPLLSFCHP